MEERQVTSDGESRPLGDRFLVVATQNPIEYEGTYPLPEAQLDRFFFKLEVNVPEPATEIVMLRRVDGGFNAHDLNAAGVTAIIDAGTLARVRAEVAAVRVSDEVLGYISAIVTATRTSPDLSLGASPARIDRAAPRRQGDGGHPGSGLRRSRRRQGRLHPGIAPSHDPASGGGDPGRVRGRRRPARRRTSPGPQVTARS